MCIAYTFSLSYHQEKAILLSTKIASNDLYIFATNTDCYEAATLLRIARPWPAVTGASGPPGAERARFEGLFLGV
jgi:hypothetical protein